MSESTRKLNLKEKSFACLKCGKAFISVRTKRYCNTCKQKTNNTKAGIRNEITVQDDLLDLELQANMKELGFDFSLESEINPKGSFTNASLFKYVSRQTAYKYLAILAMEPTSIDEEELEIEKMSKEEHVAIFEKFGIEFED